MAFSHEHKSSELDTGRSMEICTTCARFDGFGLVVVWHGCDEYKGSVSVHACIGAQEGCSWASKGDKLALTYRPLKLIINNTLAASTRRF